MIKYTHNFRETNMNSKTAKQLLRKKGSYIDVLEECLGKSKYEYTVNVRTDVDFAGKYFEQINLVYNNREVMSDGKVILGRKCIDINITIATIIANYLYEEIKEDGSREMYIEGVSFKDFELPTDKKLEKIIYNVLLY